ncbi:DUF4240 domain-containing protein [Vallicoccus soli]|uniref:DUF4240 domain-containing protein n=1 Tax=Vallicoccus soli TaxID=2339232 RepID=A0A3A3ZCX0_9ACTN|nr:DUF4240 domain-containing protein [Vallicoccus soli]RJK92982.1 DUF4240 domain-containing protein [Vallicoccus soli]
MRDDDFWTLIDGSLARSGHDGYPTGAHLAILLSELERLPLRDVVAFEDLQVQHLNELMTWRHIGAAEHYCGEGLTSDPLEYFLAWSLHLGREQHQRFVEDPDSLADLPSAESDVALGEELLLAPHTAYRRRTNKVLSAEHGITMLVRLPEGDPAERHNPAQMLPRLWALKLQM